MSAAAAFSSEWDIVIVPHMVMFYICNCEVLFTGLKEALEMSCSYQWHFYGKHFLAKHKSFYVPFLFGSQSFGKFCTNYAEVNGSTYEHVNASVLFPFISAEYIEEKFLTEMEYESKLLFVL